MKRTLRTLKPKQRKMAERWLEIQRRYPCDGRRRVMTETEREWTFEGNQIALKLSVALPSGTIRKLRMEAGIQ